MEKNIDEEKLVNVSGGTKSEPSEVNCPACGTPIPLKKSLFSSAEPGVCPKCGHELGEKWQ